MVWWFAVAFVAALVVGVALIPKPPSQKPAGIGEIQVPTAEAGREIPVLFGSRELKGPNVVWYGDFKTSAIKVKKGSWPTKKKVTINHRYFLGMHLVLASELDAITGINADEKVIWRGTVASGDFLVDAPSAFGGNEKEGGISGTFTFLPGDDAQAINSYLNTQLGGVNVPAFRGVASLVLQQAYLGTSRYIKPMSIFGTRIFKRQHGLEQWYPETAAIGDASALNLGSSWKYKVSSTTYTNPILQDPIDDILPLPQDGSQDGTSAGPFGFLDSWTAPDDVPELPVTTWPQHKMIWTWNTFTPTTFQRYGIRIHVWAENAAYIYVNGTFVGALNEGNEQVGVPQLEKVIAVPPELIVPNAPNIIHAVGLDEVGSSGSQTYLRVLVEWAPTLDMNPAHIIRECVTDPEWCLGWPEEELDDETFEAVANTLYEEGFGLSLVWDRQKPIEDFVQEIKRHIDAELYVDRFTSKFVLKLIRDDYDPDDLLHLTEDDIDQISDFSRPMFGELVTAVTVKYWDQFTGKDDSVTVQDIALTQMQGASIPATMDYPGITNRSLALRVAERDLRSLSAQAARCTIYTNRVAKDLQLGSVFKVTWPDYELNQTIMRVTGIAYGDGRNNKIRLTCVEDTYALPQTSTVAIGEPQWENPSQPAGPATNRLAFELPFHELVNQFGKDEVLAMLLGDPGAGFVGAAAEAPSGAIEARLHTNPDGAGYEEAADLDFCPTCVVTAAQPLEGEPATELEVEDLNSMDNVAVGSFGQWDEEIVGFVSLVGSTLTVKRACLDTSPKEHEAGSKILWWDEYSGIDQTQYTDGQSLGLKVTSVTTEGELDVSLAPADTVVLDSRAIRPYPPAYLRVDGSFEPEPEPAATFDVSWVSRNRLTQTELVGYTEGTIAPEDGTTYEVRKYVNNVLKGTHSGVEDNFLNGVTVPESGTVRIEVQAFRDGYGSWQFPAISFPYVAEGPDELWTPLHLSTAPSIVLDDLSDVTNVSGTASQWNDRSGNNWHYSQGTGSQRPTINSTDAGIGGKRSLSFDGSNDFLSCGVSGVADIFRNVTAGWGLAVVKKNGTDGSPTQRHFFSFPVSSPTNTTRWALLAGNTGTGNANSPAFFARRLDADSAGSLNYGSPLAGQYYIMMAAMNWGTGNGVLYVNGQAVAAGAVTSAGSTSNTASSGAGLGAFITTSAPIGHADVSLAAAIAGRATLPSAEEVEKLFGWAAHNFSLQSVLPDSHMYKRYAPTLIPYDVWAEEENYDLMLNEDGERLCVSE